MPPNRWRGDCSRCAALCCLSLAFDRGAEFAFDKRAGEPCPLLTASHTCSIHAQRGPRGFGGCIAYDCLGAGQRVTAELFGGRSWQAEPALSRPMLEAFWRMRQLHELLLGLALAQRLELESRQARRCHELARELDPPGGFSRASLDALDLGTATREVRELLSGSSGRLASGQAARRRLPLAPSGDALGVPDHDVEPACEVRERGRPFHVEPVHGEHAVALDRDVGALQRPPGVVHVVPPQ
jgi:hypothetical protein